MKNDLVSPASGKRPLVWLQVLIVVATAAVVAMTIFLGNRTFRETKRIATEQFNRQQLILAQSAARGIESYFKELSVGLQSMARMPQFQQMDLKCMRCMEHVYWGFPPRTSLRLLDKDGVLRLIYPNHDWRQELIGRNYSKEIFFREAAKDGHVGVHVVANERGEDRIRVAVAIYSTPGTETIKGVDGTGVTTTQPSPIKPDPDRFCGVLVGSLDPRMIAQNLIRPITSGKTGYAWFLDDKGVFLAHYEKDFVGRNAFQVRTEKDPEILYHTIGEIQRKMLAGEEGLGRYSSGWHKDETGEIGKLVAYTPVRVDNKVWSVAVCAPVSEVEEVIRANKRFELYMLSFVILVLVAGGVLLLAISRRWSRRLAHQVQIRTRELKETSDYLSRLIKYANAPIIVWDPDRKITIFNKAFEQMSGRHEAEMLEGSLDALFPSESRSESLRKIESTANGQFWDNVEIPILHKDGQVRVGLWNSANIYSGDGKTLVATVAQGQDITKRKRAEEYLRKSEERFRAIFETAQDSIFIKDRELRYVQVNPAMEGLFGLPESKLIGKSDAELFGKEAGQHVAETDSRVLAGEIVEEEDTKPVHGSPYTFHVIKAPMRDSSGEIIGLCGIARDITARRHAERVRRIQHDLAIDLSMTSDLAESVDRLLETIFRMESIDCGGVYLVDDRTGDLELVSYKGLSQQFVENASHYGADSPQTRLVMKGEPLYGFYPKLFPSVDETHKQESLHAFATIPVKYEGKIIAVLNLASHTHDAIPDSTRDLLEGIAAQIGGVIARVRAEEGKTELEAQLRQAVKMEAIGRLAGGIAHDFNNMLAIIQGYADLLLKDMDADDRNRDDVKRIRTASKRAAALTRQLLAFGRRQAIRPEVLDLNEILADTDSMLQRIIGEDIELVTKPGEDLWHVKADPRQIEEQVILNLAVNAREAMLGGGKLTIATANIVLDEEYAVRHTEVTPGEYVMLVVSDTGAGMSEEIMSHVFEPFFSTKQSDKSSGLGLSTIYGIIKQSGGHIEVESTPGQGSTFRTYLPRAKKPIKSTTAEPGPDQSGRGTEIILVAEDEPLVRDLLCRILRETGYTVLVASDGREAINAATNEGKIHLLVTDVVMPHMSGKELSDQIRVEHPDIKVLFVSGYTDNAISHHGVLHKGVNFLAKPFTSAQLTRTVRRVLDAK